MVYHRGRFNKRKRTLFGHPQAGSYLELVSLGDHRAPKKVRLDARRPPFTRARYERTGARSHTNDTAMLNSSLQRSIRDGARMLTLQETQQGSMREFESRLRAAERDVARLSMRPLKAARELDNDIAMGEAAPPRAEQRVPPPRVRATPRADADMPTAAPAARSTPPPPPPPPTPLRSMGEGNDGAVAATSKPRGARDTANPSAMIALPARTGDDAMPPAAAMRQYDTSLATSSERPSTLSPGAFPVPTPADTKVGALVARAPRMTTVRDDPLPTAHESNENERASRRHKTHGELTDISRAGLTNSHATGRGQRQRVDPHLPAPRGAGAEDTAPPRISRRKSAVTQEQFERIQDGASDDE